MVDTTRPSAIELVLGRTFEQGVPVRHQLGVPREAVLRTALTGVGFLVVALVTREMAGLICGVFAAVLLLAAWLGALCRTQTSVTPTEVTISRQILGVRRHASTPLTEYRGVLLASVTLGLGDDSRSFQVVELHHDDRRRCIPLLARLDDCEPRREWESYARTLGLPALHASHGQVIERAPDQLDEPLRGRVGCGADAPHPTVGAPPRGLAVLPLQRDEPAVTRIQIRATRFPVTAYASVIASCGIAIAGPFGFDPSAIVVVSLFAAGWAFIAAHDLRSRRELRIAPHAVSVHDPWVGASVEPVTATIKIEDIEELRIARQTTTGQLALWIDSDGASLVVGAGLSIRALRWLERYVASAIVSHGRG